MIVGIEKNVIRKEDKKPNPTFM
ncbi:hypothetical protein CHRYSEO8AT_560162 [Chryseobacterium sp. 8AT]|nr:hypothetical protein CHRYSEO8AT_560162 [Chryseobacterium sp. 8AT]